jgi:hypothetical protein
MGAKKSSTHRNIADHLRHKAYLDNKNVEYALKAFISYMYCYQHTQQGNDKLHIWLSTISAVIMSMKAAGSQDDKLASESMIVRSRREGTPPADCWPDVIDNSKFITHIKPDRPAYEEGTYELIK